MIILLSFNTTPLAAADVVQVKHCYKTTSALPADCVATYHNHHEK